MKKFTRVLTILLVIVATAFASHSSNKGDKYHMPVPSSQYNLPEVTKCMTYNVRVLGVGAVTYNQWINVRRWNIQKAVVENDVDFAGFQEVRSTFLGNNQQSDLEETFDDSPYKFCRFDDPSMEPYASHAIPDLALHNKNPFVVHKRNDVIACGTRLIDWTEILQTDTAFQNFSKLHTYFHGADTDGDGANDFAHHFDPFRHCNWIVVQNGNRKVLVLNTHYETFPGENEYPDKPGSAQLWDLFMGYIDACFTYTSQMMVNHAADLADEYDVEDIILMGDLEVGEEGHAWLQPFVDGGYVDTWWAVPHSGGPQQTTRFTGGVDHIYVTSLKVIDSRYDADPAYTGTVIASDHKPLWAELELK